MMKIWDLADVWSWISFDREKVTCGGYWGQVQQKFARLWHAASDFKVQSKPTHLCTPWVATWDLQQAATLLRQKESADFKAPGLPGRLRLVSAENGVVQPDKSIHVTTTGCLVRVGHVQRGKFARLWSWNWWMASEPRRLHRWSSNRWGSIDVPKSLLEPPPPSVWDVLSKALVYIMGGCQLPTYPSTGEWLNAGISEPNNRPFGHWVLYEWLPHSAGHCCGRWSGGYKCSWGPVGEIEK